MSIVEAILMDIGFLLVIFMAGRTAYKAGYKHGEKRIKERNRKH
jgi:uncharacterized membrane protein